MKTTSYTIPLFLLASQLTLADLIIRSAQPQFDNSGSTLARRQFCPATYGFCLSGNGDAVCQSVDEVCCQLLTGTNPYTCPLDHPYCCPTSATGTLLCGADSSCSGPIINGPSGILPTAATGTGGGATATGKPAGSTATVAPVSSPTTSSKNSGALGTGEERVYGKGLFAAVLAIAAAVM